MAEEAQAIATESPSSETPLTEEQILDQIEQEIASEMAAAATEASSETDQSAQDKPTETPEATQEPPSETKSESATPEKSDVSESEPDTLTREEYTQRLDQAKRDQAANLDKRVEDAVTKARAEERANARQEQDKADFEALSDTEKSRRVMQEREHGAIVEAAKPTLFAEWGVQMAQEVSPLMMGLFDFESDPTKWGDDMKAAWTGFQNEHRTANDGQEPGFVDNMKFLKSRYDTLKEAEFERRMGGERKKWTGVAEESEAASEADSESEPPVVGSNAGGNGALPSTFEAVEDLLATTTNLSPALMARYKKLAAQAGVTISL